MKITLKLRLTNLADDGYVRIVACTMTFTANGPMTKILDFT